MSKREGPSLIIAGHGSKQPQWTAAFENLTSEVRAHSGIKLAFGAVKSAFLEEARPSLAEVVTQELHLGASEILVTPLFLNVSSHVSEDLPGVLGLPTPPHIRRRLQGEGIELCPEGLPVRLQPLGPIDEVLFRNVLRRLSLRTKAPAHEGVFLVGYGSALYHDAWERLLDALHQRLMREQGFAHSAHGYCGPHDQETSKALTQAIRLQGTSRPLRRLHVLPLLLAESDLQFQLIAKVIENLRPDLMRHGVHLHYEADAILPDGDLAAFVAMRSLEGLGLNAALGTFSAGKLSLA